MNRFRLLAILILVWGLLIAAASAKAQQGPGQQLVTATYNNEPLEAVLQDLQEKHALRIFYLDEWLEGVRVTQAFKAEPLLSALRQVLAGTQLTALHYDPQTVVLVPRLSTDTDTAEVAEAIAGAAPESTRRRMVTLSGQVRDAKTKEPGIGATVVIDELKKGTVTDEKGRFSLTIPAGSYTLEVRSVGMVTDRRRLQLQQSRIMDVELFEVSNELREVEVSTVAPDQNVASLEMGVARLNIKEVKTIPAFLGEVDIVRSVLAMPGVTTVGEGATGFNVRGGSVDQNLVLQDEAPLFNSSHLFGFFSVFNPDMVKDVTLYRGGIPAKYGGRASSVLDVQLRDGNKKGHIVSGGIGLLSSRLMVEGPLAKDKASFILGARGAYPGLMMRYVPDKSVRDSDGYFYDFNGKVSYTLSEKDQLILSGYLSRDSFRFGADTTYAWGTATGTAKWNHTFTNKLFSTVTGVIGDYAYGVSSETAPYDYTLDSDIKYKLLKADLNYEPSEKHQVGVGASATWYKFNSGELKPTSEQSSLLHIKMPEERSLEAAVYLDHQYTLSPKVSVSYGLRYSSYFNLGPGEVYVYNPEVPRRASSITDTLYFDKGEKIKQYNYLEPRASLRVTLDENSSVKLGYNRMVQYIHLISNTTAVSPVDIWKTSNPYLKPQVGDQVALGYFRNFDDNSVEFSAEGYYKKLYNLVEYKDGARLLLNKTLDADLLPGEGKAYGVELMVRRKGKKLTGWASYTFSRALRQVDGTTPEEKINRGELFPSNFDKPHDFTVVMNQQLSRLISVSANFTYSTGRPTTYPESVAKIGGLLMVNYSDRNQYRIPDYHRLDVALIIDGSKKRNPNSISNWTFSVYNLYGRKNPYSVYFKPIYGGSIPQAYKLSVIGSAVPAISYNFKIMR
ncbi:TonB-dependent receptor [Pontibacter chinhatensis]|uniref:Outer membrane receptor proteins, mostly Fe transport n=1 Tax=Pontibacter chinhatensis TaxID=1436961 RepID=A0A1I2TCY2_9BACT|nr:TonB-dependent receptor [Pontibacter chinhatensis]SFG62688.1 Outer membrane receptor proteins, mostly Fe transport [Pontibacter chinhatensis]